MPGIRQKIVLRLFTAFPWCPSVPPVPSCSGADCSLIVHGFPAIKKPLGQGATARAADRRLGDGHSRLRVATTTTRSFMPIATAIGRHR